MSFLQFQKSIIVTLLGASLLGAQAQHGDPYEPVGELTVTPTVVQVGVKPQMFWGIDYPEATGDLVDLGDNSEVYTNKNLRVKVRVVGVAFQSGSTHLPVALWARVGTGGSWQLLFYGRSYNVNPAQFVLDVEVPENTRIDFAARGRNQYGQWLSTRWTLDTQEECIGLQNGDEVPAYAPAYNQGSLEDFLTQFIEDTDDDGNMNVVLGPRDLIYLFELASTNPGDWWFDMQDLVTVVTFEDTDGASEDEGDPSADDYVNFVRQIQQDQAGVEWDVWVEPNGSQLSPAGVSGAGSFFQLWSMHNTSATEYLLGEQFVTSYTPNGAITVVTEDPYSIVPRTRVDRPYTVTFNVAGLLDPGPGVPLAATQVALSHEAFLYPDGAYSLEGVNNPTTAIVQSGSIEDNGMSTLSYAITNLHQTGVSDVTTAAGEEIITLSALADYSVTATVLDSQRLQVWPIAQATLTGYSTDSYYEDVPTLNIVLKDLYPSSATYLRIYPGETPGEDVKVVSSSYVLINDSIPQDRVLSLEDLDSFFTNEGVHTLEILHETPFGVDVLFSSTINVDRTVEITGAVYSRE